MVGAPHGRHLKTLASPSLKLKFIPIYVPAQKIFQARTSCTQGSAYNKLFSFAEQ